MADKVSQMCKKIHVNSFAALKRDYDDIETELIEIAMRYRSVYAD